MVIWSDLVCVSRRGHCKFLLPTSLPSQQGSVYASLHSRAYQRFPDLPQAAASDLLEQPHLERTGPGSRWCVQGNSNLLECEIGA